MWPMLLDLSRDECKRILRKLELEAYASIITAFRAQGSLTKEKKKLLQDLSSMLSISLERHRAEIRRAVNDEHLNTIADRISGPNTSADWSIEGRRLIPLMPRLVPQTAFTAMANAVASIQAAKNASMPLPSSSGVKEGSIPTTSSAPPTPSRTPTPTHTCKLLTSANGIKTSPTDGSSPITITSGVAMKISHQEQEEDIDDESNGRKRKRSASLDSAPLPEKIIATSQPVSSVDNQVTEKQIKNVNSVPFPASTSLLSQISPTVRATYGATPIRIALPPAQKQATAVSSSPTPKQVVLMPASSTSTSSTIFQRSVNIPIVKTVSTTAATITQNQSKLLSCSQSPSVQGALLMTGKLATSPSIITTTGQINTVGTIARPLAKTLPIPRQIMRPRSSVLPLTYQNKVQLIGQNFSAQLPTPTVRQSLHLGTPIQVKQVSTVGRTAVQIRHEGGVKIVAQGLPVAGSKILPKPTASPIVMVSSTQSGGTLARFTTPSVVPQNTFGTKVVSLSGSQAQVTSKVTTIGNVSLVSRTGHGFATRGNPTIIQPPGVKPNVIVVHKAQVWPQSQGQGTTIVVSGGSVPKLSAEAVQEAVTYIQKQERNRISTPATIISLPLANAVITSTPATAMTKTTMATTTNPSSNSEKHVLSCESANIISDNKSQAIQNKIKEEVGRKSNLLADLIEATGILSDSSESSLLTGSVKALVDEVKKTPNIEEELGTKLEGVKEINEQEIINETWTNESRSQEIVPLETNDQKESREEQQQLLSMDPTSMNIQDLNLPLEQLDEGQILEIQTQDEEGLLSQSTRLTKEMLEELLQQAGLHIQGVEMKSELQNEGNQTSVATTTSVLNIPKSTSTLSADEVASQSKCGDLKPTKENTIDSCMKLVLCEQNSPFESANIEKAIEEIALKDDEVFENSELQQKCTEEEENQSDEQTTVIELLNSEFSVSQLEDDQFVETELDIPQLTKSSPRKEDEDSIIAKTATVPFPSKRYLSRESVKVDYITAMPEEELKGIFQKKSLETVQLEVKDVSSIETSYSNVRVEPSGLDTSSMNLEDFTSQRVEGNSTDHCPFDVSQELGSTIDIDNTEENIYPTEDTCESTKEIICKPDEKNICKPIKENTFEPMEENFKSVEENTFTLAEENTCESSCKSEKVIFTSAENNTFKSIKKGVCETVKLDICNSNQGSTSEPIKKSISEPAVANICISKQESICQRIIRIDEDETLKSAEINTTLSAEENLCKLSEGTSCISFKENISKPPEKIICNPVEELIVVTAEESSKQQSECLLESSEEPPVEGSNADIPVRRKRKYPIELQELPHLTGWARMASGLLEKVCKFRGPGRLVGAAHWFLQPVISAEAPGYYDVVKQPMDFSTIKKKLENGCYQNLKEFHADMMLVRSNCELYNPPGHEARTDCEEVFSFYLQEYNRIVEKWQKSHLLSSSRRTKTAKE